MGIPILDQGRGKPNRCLTPTGYEAPLWPMHGPPCLFRAMRGIALLLAPWIAGCEAPACTQPVAVLNLLKEPTGLYVPLAIDGKPVKLLLDTGSTNSLLTSETAQRLGLTIERLLDDSDVLIGFAIEGLGGRRHIDRAWPHRIQLAGALLLGVAFPVVWSRHTSWDTSADGLLGMDILSRYDLDLDVGLSRLTLYEPGGLCPPPGGSQSSTTNLSQDLAVFGPRLTARIDGQAFNALIDTGTQRSSIMAHAAARLARRDEREGEHFAVYGVGTGHASAVMRGFGAMSFGSVVLPQLQLAVVTAPGLGGLDIVLGTDVLARYHIWLSSRRHSLTLAERRPQDALTR